MSALAGTLRASLRKGRQQVGWAFPGQNSIIDADRPAVGGLNQLSYAATFRLTTDPSNNTLCNIIHFQSGGGTLMGIAFIYGGLSVDIGSQTGGGLLYLPGIDTAAYLNKYCTIFAVYDAALGMMIAYRQFAGEPEIELGRLSASGPVSPPSTDTFIIGSFAERRTLGLIYQVQVWSRALSHAERVAYSFNAIPSPAQKSDLLYYLVAEPGTDVNNYYDKSQNRLRMGFNNVTFVPGQTALSLDPAP